MALSAAEKQLLEQVAERVEVASTWSTGARATALESDVSLLRDLAAGKTTAKEVLDAQAESEAALAEALAEAEPEE